MKRWTIVLACLIVTGALGAYVAGPLLLGQQARQPPAAEGPAELYSYRDLVKRVLPAVVSIEARSKVVKARASAPRRNPRSDKRQLPEDFRKQLPDDFRRFFDELPDQLPDNPEPRMGFGSGFLVDPSGVVLTNNHVVADAEQVTVELHDGRKFVTRDIKTDPRTDLAIVRIHPKDGKALPFLQLGDSEKMEIGDRVLAVGAPFGLTGSVTHGIVSGKGRNGFHMNMYEDFLQTDAPINPGNSGGPLVNLQGKVVGINAAIKSRSGGFQGVGLAIASNLARTVMKSLMTEGVVHRGYLGVKVSDLSEDVARHLGLKDKSGVVIAEVSKGSPAASAGLQPGDILTQVGGKTIKDGRVLQTTIAGLPLHKAINVTVVRDGQTKVLPVTIEEQPQDYGLARESTPSAPERGSESVGVDKIGVDLGDLTPDVREQLGYKREVKGAVLTRVETGGVAWEAGLRQGMVIRKVNKRQVESANAARQALEKGSLERGILLQVQSPRGGTNYVLLQQQGAAAGSN
jgi:serine protease Do